MEIIEQLEQKKDSIPAKLIGLIEESIQLIIKVIDEYGYLNYSL